MSHSSRKLSAIDIDVIDKIWCMSFEHKKMILEKFPEAENKINCLDEKDLIPVPHGNGVAAYIECALKLEQLIDGLIKKKEIAFT